MKHFFKLATLFLVVAFFSSCATKKTNSQSADSDLLNSKWRFIEIANMVIKKEVNGRVPYLSFDKSEKRYSAITGCNTVNGTLDVTNDKIKFGIGMSTMMFCEDMSVEDGFKKILEKVESFKIEGNELVLLGSDNKVLAKLNKYSN